MSAQSHFFNVNRPSEGAVYSAFYFHFFPGFVEDAAPENIRVKPWLKQKKKVKKTPNQQKKVKKKEKENKRKEREGDERERPLKF